MKKIAVFVAPGFEEIETVAVADILRRGEQHCDLVGLENAVTGVHGISIQCDRVIDDKIAHDYDMVVLPGGRPGADNLRDNDLVIKAIKDMEKEDKWIAAICAAPIALGRAGVLEGKNFTAYPGVDKEIKDRNFKEDIVVVDGKIITSRGPATVFEFSYSLLDLLGVDTSHLREDMLYNFLIGE
ncbi:DJ-1 family glyoxalase III [uncultured Helcococcus sp.]|uniref:DJ-1 family glyoxalase III n=1 Tax=uncultured Helcococcus sp. TaxID=1072508 RepID=UPI002889DFA6|nr:DJ-1 family glyoxalase III [uncultured Helcococcus sp.]